MLDTAIQTQLRSYLERLQHPIELIASLDDGEKSRELRELLTEIAALSDKVSASFDGTDARKPSFAVTRSGDVPRIQFAGLPMGHEFTSLILALLQTGGVTPKLDAEVIEQIRALPGTYNFITYVSLSCQNCPDVVQALNAIAALHPRATHVMVDGALFQDEVNAKGILAVPSVYLEDEPFNQGRTSIEEILAKLDSGAADAAAARLSEVAPFDVLVVGGGPAGSAAAVYAARKGIRTGVVAERFGGQVQDTMGIENFISVPHTEGPKLAAQFEQHVREYGVDVIKAQRAEKLEPAGADGLATVRLHSGVALRAKTVILSTGARWRMMNIPGEREHLGKGVCFCPHCDGPLFKGKRVAVIGGGNSGVEAAIDLAGVVGHVTLIEFMPELRADAVLQRKLESLPNVVIVKNAQTTEVTGDGSRLNALKYKDRASGEEHTLELEGIFVQIGLLPNTEWLKDSITLTPRGEIQIDERCATSMPGVFAAGDATTVPYKQIVIAMGEGAKASLSAFDHLIRTSAPA